jgi:hypothetical protein
MSVNELQFRLDSLRKQAQQLRDKGAIAHPDFRLDCAENVPGSGKFYYRKRFKPGAVSSSGKRSEVISKQVYQQLQQQLRQGRTLRKMEKQIAELIRRIDETVAAERHQLQPGSKVQFWQMCYGARVEMQGILVSQQNDKLFVATVLSNGMCTLEVNRRCLL